MIKVESTLCVGLAGVGALAVTTWAFSLPVTDWKIAGPFGGTATTITVDPQNSKTVLAGAMSSLLYQSQDFGASWVPLDLPRRTLGEVTSILVDPVDSSHYLVGMLDAFGGGLYSTHDSGKTWLPTKEIKDIGVRALVAAPSNPSEFVAGTLAGVMISTDSGATWTRISDSNNPEMLGITAVAIDPKDPNTIYAGTPHLPWKSTDGGKSWMSIHSGMIDDSDVFSIYIDPAVSNNVFASACSGIYSSLDRGDSWRKLAGIPNTSRRTHVIREDPTLPNTVYAGTTMGLFKSTNGGVNWKTLTTTQVNSLAFDPTQPAHLYAAMEYDGIGKSENSGETLRTSNQGFVDRQISSVSISGDKLVSIETQEGETTGIFLSADKGDTWAQLSNVRGLGGIHLRNIAGSRKENRILLGSTQHRLFKTLDGGMSWKEIPLRMNVTPPTPKVQATGTVRRSAAGPRRTVASHPAKPKTILRTVFPTEIVALYSLRNDKGESMFAATDLGLFRSSNMGDDWTLLAINGATGIQAVYSPANADGRMVVRSTNKLYATSNGGDTWDELDFPLSAADVNEIAVPLDPAAPWLAATRVGIYSSGDAGKTWSLNHGDMQGSTVASIVYGATTDVFAVAYGQLFESKDSGKTWSAVPSALHAVTIRQLWKTDLASARLYAITSGLGVLFRDEVE